MIDILKIKIGDKVYYQPEYFGDNKWENGIVKEIPDFSLNSIRIVYNSKASGKILKNILLH